MFAWLFRPSTGEARAAFPYALEEIQRREGLPIDATRTYAEFSMEWLSWYVGVPILLLGCLGVAAAVFRALGRDMSWSVRTACLSLLVPAAVYIYRPSINPDHIWAMRRFLPIVIPGFLISAMVVAGWLTSRFRFGPAPLVPLMAATLLTFQPISTASAALGRARRCRHGRVDAFGLSAARRGGSARCGRRPGGAAFLAPRAAPTGVVRGECCGRDPRSDGFGRRSDWRRCGRGDDQIFGAGNARRAPAADAQHSVLAVDSHPATRSGRAHNVPTRSGGPRRRLSWTVTRRPGVRPRHTRRGRPSSVRSVSGPLPGRSG